MCSSDYTLIFYLCYPADELADMNDLDIDEAEHEGDNEDSDTEDMDLPPVPDLSKYVFSKHTGEGKITKN